MVRKILMVSLLGLMALFIAPGWLAAAEADVSLTDNIIASTFKTLAKTFTVAIDLDTIKVNNIKKIKNMTDEKFSRRYAKIYNLLKDYPYFCAHYGFSEGMVKDEAIIKIAALDKKAIYEIIDAVPVKLIAAEFKAYLKQRQIALQKSNLSVQIQQFWKKAIKSATGG